MHCQELRTSRRKGHQVLMDERCVFEKIRNTLSNALYFANDITGTSAKTTVAKPGHRGVNWDQK